MRFFKLFYLDIKMLLRRKEVVFWTVIFPPIMLIVMGFLFPEKGLGVEKGRYIEFLTPGIIGLTIMMGGLTGTPARLVSYRQRGILLRLTLTPLTSTKFLFIEMFVSMCLILTQSLLLLFLGRLLFNIGVMPLGRFIIASLIGIMIFTAFGGAIAGFNRTAEGADASANLIATPLMFLSGVFFPIEQLPQGVQKLTKMLPLTQILTLIRTGFQQGRLLPWVVLIVWCVVGVVLAAAAIKIDYLRSKRG